MRADIDRNVQMTKSQKITYAMRVRAMRFEDSSYAKVLKDLCRHTFPDGSDAGESVVESVCCMLCGATMMDQE